jgi:hypothetical protein
MGERSWCRRHPELDVTVDAKSGAKVPARRIRWTLVSWFVVAAACAGGVRPILRHPATKPTTETRQIGEAVCWVEPAWMFPGPTDCHGYESGAPGVPRCTTTKRADAPRPRRTEWTTGYQYDDALTRETRKRDSLACCYRCVDTLQDLGD